MSRGLGARQRYILAEVERRGPCYLVDLLPPGQTRADYSALHRAACRLADDDLIGYWTYRCGLHKVVLTRVGTGQPDRLALDKARKC